MESTKKLTNKIMLFLLITIMSIFIIQPVLVNNSNMEDNSSKNYSNYQFNGIIGNPHHVSTYSGNITTDCGTAPCGGGWT